MKIAFLGLGRMGQGMAHLLVKDGYQLNVFDVFPDAAKSLVEAGATFTPTYAEAVDGRDVVISMLPTDGILESVVTSSGGLVDSMKPGTVHVVMGTHGIDMIRKVTKAHTDAGQVCGRPCIGAARLGG